MSIRYDELTLVNYTYTLGSERPDKSTNLRSKCRHMLLQSSRDFGRHLISRRSIVCAIRYTTRSEILLCELTSDMLNYNRRRDVPSRESAFVLSVQGRAPALSKRANRIRMPRIETEGGGLENEERAEIMWTKREDLLFFFNRKKSELPSRESATTANDDRGTTLGRQKREEKLRYPPEKRKHQLLLCKSQRTREIL